VLCPAPHRGIRAKSCRALPHPSESSGW
jgi:hypothetical protein